MDNNQYFFSNEEGSNDSNINMIGGMMPMGAMSPENKLKKAEEMKKSSDPAMKARGEMMARGVMSRGRGGPGRGGPGRGRGRGRGRGGPGGMGGQGSEGPNAANVAVMPTTGNSKQKIQKDSPAKDKKCKKENKMINTLTEKNKLLELKIDGLTVHLNQLQNILAVYEKQFTDFSEQKKIFDKTLTDMKEILVTKEAQKFGDEFKAMLEKRTKQANNNQETAEKECDCSGQTPNPNPGLTPPQSPNPGKPQAMAGQAQAKAMASQAPQPMAGEAPQQPPPMAGEAPQQPPPSSGQAPPLTIPNIKEQNEEEIKASFGNAFEGIKDKSQDEQQTIVTEQSKAKSNDFGVSLKSILDSFRSKETFTKDDITLAVQGISAAIGTLFTVKKIMNKSGFGLGKIIKNIARIDPIDNAKEAIPQIITEERVIPFAEQIFNGKTAAARKPLIEKFVKEYITSLGKNIEGEGDESKGEKEEGDKCKTSKTDPRGNCGENLICKKEKGVFASSKCVKDENAKTAEGQDENAKTAKGQSEKPTPTAGEQSEKPTPTAEEVPNPNPTAGEPDANTTPNAEPTGQEAVQNTTLQPTGQVSPVQNTTLQPTGQEAVQTTEIVSTEPPTAEVAPVQTTTPTSGEVPNLTVNPTVDVASSTVNQTKQARQPVDLQTPKPESIAINAIGPNAPSPEKEALKRKEELKNLEESKKKDKGNIGDKCDDKEDCKDDLECIDKKCKTKASSGGSRRRNKTRRRRGRRSQRGSGKRKKSLKKSKTN